MNKQIIYYAQIGFFIFVISIISLFGSCKNKNSDSDQNAGIQEFPETKSIDLLGKSVKYFDSSQVKISDKPLGDFPYFGLPEGYINYEKNDIVDFDQSYFWVNWILLSLEGRVLIH